MDLEYLRDSSTPISVSLMYSDHIAPVRFEERVVPEELKAGYLGGRASFADAASQGLVKAKFDTPKKIKEPPTDSSYAPNLYAASQMNQVWHQVQIIHERARENRGKSPESHWVTGVVHRIFEVVSELPEFSALIESINV